MKKNYLVVALFLFSQVAVAQNQVTVTTGTDLFISSGTEFSSEGLTLIPSSGFTINGGNLVKGTTVSHSTSNPYISRVYQFSANTAPFTGTIRIYYDDAELNGLNETALKVNIHNGTSWQTIASNTNNTVSNFVLSNAISSTVLNELTLADALSTLPLKWGPVAAYRLGQTVKIEWTTYQEVNVSGFSIERSIDGRNWTSIINGVAAGNTDAARSYTQTDATYNPQRLYYRIKQLDMDGKFSYSTIVPVAAIKDFSTLIVFPNPFTSGFNIGNADLSKIQTVELFSNSGTLVKRWRTPQSAYTVQTLAAGIYTVKIIMTDGSQQQLLLQKH
jgi:Secretion system C-terminal sorting domain